MTTHSFIAKCQSNYLRECKEKHLEENEVIILGDFAENCSFVLQDEVQGFCWNNLQCTLHPVVVYYKDGDALQSVSYCIISNKHVVGCWDGLSSPEGNNNRLQTTFSLP